jgi:CO/xanthine dehydrogenase FAD-binding subunit
MTYRLVRSLAELEAAQAGAGPVVLMAGGTDLMVRGRERLRDRPVIDVSAVPELVRVATEGDRLVVGAAVTWAACLADREIRRRAPLLAEVAARFASPAIREVATVGGNVANASPAGDGLAGLWALDAEVDLLIPGQGRVRRPIHEIVIGPGRLALPAGAVLVAFDVPARTTPEGQAFVKLVNRAWPEHPMAIAVASVAVRLRLDGAGRVELARVVLGAVAPTPVRAAAAEAVLVGRCPTVPCLAEAAEGAPGAARPVDDLRASAAYRRRVLPALVRRALARAVAGAREDAR